MSDDTKYLAAAKELGFLDTRKLALLRRELHAARRRGEEPAIRTTLLSRGIITEEEDGRVLAWLAERIEATLDVSPPPSPVDVPPSDSSGSRLGAVVPGIEAALEMGLPRYEIAHRLGRGGMGEVLSARDRFLQREVAIKTLIQAESGDATRRFIEEAQITGQLEHPNIVPVHELGLDEEERPYIVMKRVRGKSLAEVLKSGRRRGKGMTLPELLAIFRKICDAVAYAHSRGVIHCDLKPSNIMVGEFGEVLLMDWGLAKVVGAPESDDEQPVTTVRHRMSSGDWSLAGSVRGTPAFMSPEQARGEVGRLDHRSDIYSLGAILYTLLTRTPPYKGENGDAILVRVARGELEPPTRRAPYGGIPRELEAVVLKAMAFDQGDRYQSVEELQEEIDAHLAGRALQAAEYSQWEILAKWAKRNKVAVAGAAATAVVALAGIAAGVALWHRAEVLALERSQETRLETERIERERALAARTSEAERIFSQASGEEEASRDLPFNESAPQEYFVAKLPIAQRMGQAIEIHPQAPADWRERLAGMTGDLQAKAETTGEWALALHLAHSAVLWGAVGEEAGRERAERARARREEREVEDIRRLETVLSRIGEAEERGERQGFVPGELEEEARRLAALRARPALAARIVSELHRDDRRRREKVAGEVALTSLQREFLVETLSRLGNARTSPGEPTVAEVVAGELSSDVTYIRSGELAAWMRAAARLEASEPGSVPAPGARALIASASEACGGVGPVAFAASQATGFLGVVSGEVGLPAPSKADVVYDPAAPRRAEDDERFAALVRELGDWTASSVTSGTAYTRRLLELAGEGATLPGPGGDAAPLSARQQAFVLDQLGLFGDILPPDPARPLHGALEVLRSALAAPPDAWLRPGAPPESRTPAVRALTAAVGLARLSDASSAELLFERREQAGSESLFFQRTRIAARTIPMDGWREAQGASEHMLRASAWLARGEHRRALADLDRAISLDPASAAARDRRGFVHWTLGNWGEARSDYGAALSIDPNLAAAYAHRGELLYNSGYSRRETPQGKEEMREATRDLTRAIELDPANARAYVMRGLCYGELGGGDTVEDWTKALALNPNQVECHFFWGNGAVARKAWQEAVDRYSRAIEIDPEFLRAYLARAQSWLELGKPEEAIADCTRAAQIDPQDPSPFGLRAFLRSQQGDSRGAADDLARIVEIRPGELGVWQELGSLLAGMGDFERASELFSTALRRAGPELWGPLKLLYYQSAGANVRLDLGTRPDADPVGLPRISSPAGPGRYAGRWEPNDLLRDGRYHDEVEIRGEAGRTLIVRVRSNEADPMVALFSPGGASLAENDDLSPGSTDAGFELRLPESGSYSLLIATTHEGGTGNYVLELSIE
ncbi:MAG: protein kinase [Planctomycetes bacterium]|nr:protein kinase [Planctomycetota bacterium]